MKNMSKLSREFEYNISKKCKLVLKYKVNFTASYKTKSFQKTASILNFLLTAATYTIQLSFLSTR